MKKFTSLIFEINIIIFTSQIFFQTCKEKKPEDFFTNGKKAILTGFENSTEKLSADYCKSCHFETHSERESGAHAKAWTNVRFQDGFQSEKKDWCIYCHAPLEIQKDEILNSKNFLGNRFASEGINCAVCHIRNGKIHSPNANKNSAHEVIEYSIMNRSEFCASCHEFSFPEKFHPEILYSKEPMQSTFTDWKNSESERTCQSCHLKGHELIGVTDGKIFKNLIEKVDFEISEKNLLSISVQLGKSIGHNFPTGDLFRSVVLEVSTSSTFKHLIFSKKFARFYSAGNLENGFVWNRNLLNDTTIPPNQNSIHLTLDIPDGGFLFARLIYYFHDTELGGKTNLLKSQNEWILWKAKIR